MSNAYDALVWMRERRDTARRHEERRRNNPLLDVARNMTSPEDAVYWAAFYAGQADAYNTALNELASRGIL